MFHVGADGGAENAHGGERADPGDVVDGPERVLNRLDAGHDFARTRTFAQFLRSVFERPEKGLLADQLLLAGEETREVLRVMELVAEAEVVSAQINQAVVLPEVEGGNQLQTHQRAHARLHGLHVGRRFVQVPIGLVAGIEMHKRDAGFLFRRAHYFHDVLDVFRGHLIHTHIQSRGTELAVERWRVMPEAARVGYVDAEVSPLQYPHLVHGGAPRGRARVPRGLGRNAHRVAKTLARVPH